MPRQKTNRMRSDGALSMKQVYEQPGHLIRRAQQIAVAIFMEECAAFDVTPVQYAALVAIRENPGVDATRLSALVAFDRSTVGNVLERLEAKGVVARSASSEDRRVKVLHLTQVGQELLVAVEPAVGRAQARIVAPLKPEDQARLVALLGQLVALNNEFSRIPLRLIASKP
jgi:DNA-binding MarR family transcriptional regulator